MARRLAGYSLIELIVVISILAIIAAIMIPNFQNSRAQRALDEAARETETLISFAHQSAVAGGAISPILPPPPTGTSQAVAPIRMTLSNTPYAVVLMDGKNFTDAAPATPGYTVKSFQNATQVTLAVAWQIPSSMGVLGPAQTVATPFTVVFDANGSVRKTPGNPTQLETVPSIPSGSTITFTFHSNRIMDHVVSLDSVSGGVTFK